MPLASHLDVFLFCSLLPHELVKAGLTLALFGGSQKYADDKNRIPIRGDPHVLIVGDPGLGKSQMLQVSIILYFTFCLYSVWIIDRWHFSTNGILGCRGSNFSRGIEELEFVWVMCIVYVALFSHQASLLPPDHIGVLVSSNINYNEMRFSLDHYCI